MFFLNLSLPEFLMIAGSLSGLITLLYFFDRSRRKKTVSSLRFWTDAVGAQQQKRRKSVRQPWSLLLQLLSILLLMLAIARLQWGSRGSEIRNSVLLLDTSSAAGGIMGNETVLDREKRLALDYIARFGSRDQFMIVRVDELASPMTRFTADRVQLRTAIDGLRAGFSALNIEQALTYANYALRQSSGHPGEIVYLGPGRIPDAFSGSTPRLRVLKVMGVVENAGIRGISVTRSEGEEAWHAAVTIRNDGSRNRTLTVSSRFATTPFAPRHVTLRPHEENTVAYQFVANAAGRLEFRLQPGDALPADDKASVLLPVSRSANVIVYSDRPEAWRPLLDPDKSLNVRYEPTGSYQAHTSADAVILDRIAPRVRPDAASLWVDVPDTGSPLPVKTSAASQLVTQWNTDSELGAGLHARDLLLPDTKVFEIFDKDFVVASTPKGPVAVVRPASEVGPRLAEVGFDFLAEPLRYRISSPILFANLMRWLMPQTFRAVQVSAEPVGLASIRLDGSEDPEGVRVSDAEGRAIPFLLQNRTLQFFLDSPADVRITTGEREHLVSMILPQVATEEWKVPSDVPRSLPPAAGPSGTATDLWQILACLGGLGLLFEWILFGASRASRWKPRSAPAGRVVAEKRELVAK